MSGPGRLLAMTYGMFALAAGARSLTQIGFHFDAAPLPYLLSLLAAAVYLVLALTISRPDGRSRRIALAACTLELGGVLVVGAASVVRSEGFADATVWSSFGAGYGFVPVVLPLAGLYYLRRLDSLDRAAVRAAG